VFEFFYLICSFQVASKAESIEIAAASLPALQQALAAVYGSAGIVPPSNPADAPAPAVDGGEVPSEPTEPKAETAASMKIDLKHENAEVYVAAAERFVVALKEQEQREKERLEKEEREKAEQPPAEVPKSARGK
jgi:hypothetical protein